MTSVTKLKTRTSEEWRLRVDLAAAFRLAEHFNWHEGVANHFSLAVSPDGRKFLMNPKWKHFSSIRASDLLLLDADDTEAMKRPDAPDETAWCIHGRMHALVPSARCVLHLHPAYATALVSLADPEIKPIDQNTARFYKRVAYDLGYEGMANSDAEGNRLAGLLPTVRDSLARALLWGSAWDLTRDAERTADWFIDLCRIALPVEPDIAIFVEVMGYARDYAVARYLPSDAASAARRTLIAASRSAFDRTDGDPGRRLGGFSRAFLSSAKAGRGE